MSAAAAEDSVERLRKAAPHVAHDIRMLREAWLNRDNVFAYTAWFIHCRTVMDFLDGLGSHPDDIYATHFFDNPAVWSEIEKGSPKPSEYADYREAVNKLAAHLTYTRIAYGEQERFKPSKAIHDNLLGRSAAFIRALPPERVAWFAGLGL